MKMTSLFRPALNPVRLDDHRALVRRVERRGFLRGGVSLGALTMLTGCNIEDNASVESALLAISRFNDRVQALIFDQNKLAPTYPASLVINPPRFNAFYEIEGVRAVDGDAWRLELAGKIADKTPWTALKLAELPQQEEIIRHICIEGWDYIGQWSGVNLRMFLERVGADLTSKYVYFKCYDDYSTTLDMATALHPQTILATRYAGQRMGDPFGFPLRLRTSTKLGYKNAKWITAIEVTDTNEGGFWEKAGENWFSGI